MGIPRTIALVLFCILTSSVDVQAGQSTYQCSSNGTLNGGYLIFTTENLQAVAKHANGIVSEVSGVVGPTLLGQDVNFNNVVNDSSSYAEMNGLVKSPDGMMTQEAPDREDIETSTMRTDPRPGDQVPPKPGNTVGRRIGDQAPLKAGDQAHALSDGQIFQHRSMAKLKNGELATQPGIISFSARLNQQGSISEINYRDGKKPVMFVRIDTKSPTTNDQVYATLNRELKSIKAYASCCTQNPSPVCRSGERPAAQVSLKTVKPAVPQGPDAKGSILVSPFGKATDAEAK